MPPTPIWRSIFVILLCTCWYMYTLDTTIDLRVGTLIHKCMYTIPTIWQVNMSMSKPFSTLLPLGTFVFKKTLEAYFLHYALVYVIISELFFIPELEDGRKQYKREMVNVIVHHTKRYAFSKLELRPMRQKQKNRLVSCLLGQKLGWVG